MGENMDRYAIQYKLLYGENHIAKHDTITHNSCGKKHLPNTIQYYITPVDKNIEPNTLQYYTICGGKHRPKHTVTLHNSCGKKNT